MNEEQEEALTAVQSAFGDAEAFADALQNEAHSHYQEIFSRGHSTATGQKKEDLEELETELAETKQALEDRKEQVQQLEEDQPDVEEAVTQVRENELQPLREKHEQLQGRLESKAKQDGKRAVKQRLVQEGLDEFIADAVVEQHLNGRLDVSDDFEPKFLEDAERGIPLETGDKDSADVMASRLLDQVPEQHRPNKEQGGSRSTEPNGSAGRNGSTQGMTKADIGVGEFAEEYDGDIDEAVEAYNQLPDE